MLLTLSDVLWFHQGCQLLRIAWRESRKLHPSIEQFDFKIMHQGKKKVSLLLTHIQMGENLYVSHFFHGREISDVRDFICFAREKDTQCPDGSLPLIAGKLTALVFTALLATSSDWQPSITYHITKNVTFSNSFNSKI